METKQFRAALLALELSQADAATWLKLSKRTVAGYATGAPIPEPVAMLLRLVLRLRLKPEQVQ